MFLDCYIVITIEFLPDGQSRVVFFLFNHLAKKPALAGLQLPVLGLVIVPYRYKGAEFRNILVSFVNDI
jgi:hypothetical protein